jgi:hypothetical protein
MSYEEYDRLTREVQYLAELQKNESERSNVLSVACFLEDRLRDVLLRFAGTPKVAIIELKNDRRPKRNTFEWRILEARERQLLPDDVLIDVDTIRKIRNIFGHTLGARSLNTVARAECESLTLPDKPREEREATPNDRPRHRFNISALRTIQAFVSRIFEDEHEYRRMAAARREEEMARQRAEEP